ncbi:unnamed protein product [Arabis nemorensis]|uniref:Uncharacterized protein n=1 Tax=Arabis nemorensis TaxID=586526 RepID=A0A565CPX5_9BRAS|nr:unnamed protein product [Arabis nemorensis]
MELHNFIRQNNIGDVEFEEPDASKDVLHGKQTINDDTNDDQSVRVEENTEAGAYMKVVRDQIAKEIWIAKSGVSRFRR